MFLDTTNHKFPLLHETQICFWICSDVIYDQNKAQIDSNILYIIGIMIWFWENSLVSRALGYMDQFSEYSYGWCI